MDLFMSDHNDAHNPLSEEIKQYSHLRTISMLIVTIFLFSVCAGAYFIYTRVYATMAQAKQELIINPAITQEVVDFDKYESAKKTWETKTSTPTINHIKNPFWTTTSTTTISTTTL